MKRPPLHVRIRPIEAGEVRELEWRLPGTTLDVHRVRFDRQTTGALAYLVAWYDGTSIGHVVVAWKGEEAVLEDLFVLPQFRRRGVGAQLVARAEAAAVSGGRQCIAVLVPRVNRPARRLFSERGYRSERRDRVGQPVRLSKALTRDYSRPGEGCYSPP